jgi:hypothetical protein
MLLSEAYPYFVYWRLHIVILELINVKHLI